MSGDVLNGEQRLLRIYVGEEDKFQHKRLSNLILESARHTNLAGCTQLRGIESFGERRRVHNEMQMEGTGWDLPIVIEIVDSPEKVNKFLKDNVSLLENAALVTEERAVVHHYMGLKRPDDMEGKQP